MSSYIKQLTCVVFALFLATLVGCGGSDDNVDTESPLWCKAPETLTEDGTACEFIPSNCNYPEIEDPAKPGQCMMDRNEWIDGSNGITMPTPDYAAVDGEMVIYYNVDPANTANADITPEVLETFRLHAWNNADCNSWADFDETGGTGWESGVEISGRDDNFGVYWILPLTEKPNCINFIPHETGLGIQTQDISFDVFNKEVNPNNSVFVLDKVADGNFAEFIMPFPRTFESMVVPGGGSLVCQPPLVANEAGDECIEDPTKLETFVPAETTLLLRGDFNGWLGDDATDDQKKDAQFDFYDGVFTVVLPLTASDTAYSFKVADANWSEPTSFGAALTEGEITLGAEPKTLVVGEDTTENLSLLVTEDANYQFTFNAANPEEPALTVTKVALDGVMYVKGSINEWSNTVPMTYEGDGIYTYALAIAPAAKPDDAPADDPADKVYAHNFKIADTHWTEATNFGAAKDDEDLALEVAHDLVVGEGIAENINLYIAEAGTYKFTLDVSNPDLPTVTVENAVPYGTAEMLLKGSMNGWAKADGYAFTYDENHYTLGVVLEAGAYEFKIADDGWNDNATIGALTDAADVVIGEARELTLPGDGNITLNLDESTFLYFDLDATDKSKPMLTVVDTFYQERDLYLKGSMNAWSTNADYVFTYDLGVYTLETTLTAGSQEFKVASDGWEDDSTMGLPDGVASMDLDTAATLNLKGNNIVLDIAEDGTYVFTMDITDPTHPVLTVVKK